MIKPLTRLYLKIFIATGFSFGIISLIIDLYKGTEIELWKYIFSTFFFGLLMSLVLVYLHKNKLKKSGINEINEANLKVTQSRDIQTDLNKSELIKKLNEDPSIRKMKIKEIENGIVISTKMTLWSLGEIIKIELKSTKDSVFEYNVSSRPKLKITLIDYGKNIQNIDLIKKVIT